MGLAPSVFAQCNYRHCYETLAIILNAALGMCFGVGYSVP
jgi:hypothetical protein